jgi:hypothetical protein
MGAGAGAEGPKLKEGGPEAGPAEDERDPATILSTHMKGEGRLGWEEGGGGAACGPWLVGVSPFEEVHSVGLQPNGGLGILILLEAVVGTPVLRVAAKSRPSC